MLGTRRLGFQQKISSYLLGGQHGDFIKPFKHERERELGSLLIEQLDREPGPVVVSLTSRQKPDIDCVVIDSIVDIVPVETMKIRRIDIPPFEFVRAVESGKVIEWQCSYCGMVNPIEAFFCGDAHKRAAGCGHPRLVRGHYE